MLTKNEDALAAISSFEDAMALLGDAGISVHSTEEFGDGFSVLETKDKVQLVNVPFVILGMRFSTGDNGDFVIIHLVTKDGRKLILTDGSTGIYSQAVKYNSKGISAGLYVPKGLIKSDLRYDEKSGKVVRPSEPGYDEAKAATTYYLS